MFEEQQKKKIKFGFDQKVLFQFHLPAAYFFLFDISMKINIENT